MSVDGRAASKKSKRQAAVSHCLPRGSRLSDGSRRLHSAVVVAVVAVWVMQVPVDHVVDVITVGHRFMPAAGAMPMGLFVTATGMRRGAVGRIGRRYLQPMLHDFATGLVMQVPVVQVIDMIAVSDGGVAAARAMMMVVIGVFVSHDSLLPRLPHGNRPGLCGMSQGIVDQVQNVLIRQSVIQVRSIASSLHQALVPENA